MPKTNPDTRAIIIANDLRTGCSVFLNEDDEWSSLRSDAVQLSGSEVDTGLAVARQHEALNQVLEPYSIELAADGKPVHIREYIRAYGPSIGSAARTASAMAAG